MVVLDAYPDRGKTSKPGRRKPVMPIGTEFKLAVKSAANWNSRNRRILGAQPVQGRKLHDFVVKARPYLGAAEIVERDLDDRSRLRIQGSLRAPAATDPRALVPT